MYNFIKKIASVLYKPVKYTIRMIKLATMQAQHVLRSWIQTQTQTHTVSLHSRHHHTAVSAEFFKTAK